MSNGKRIGVAVIGYGYWSPKIIRNLRSQEDTELKVICEKNRARHEIIRTENPGVDVEEDYRTVFSRKDIQAVIVATIPSSHFRIAKLALEAGKHVLVEKPMTLTVPDGELLKRITEDRALVLMVDHTYLYSEAIRALRGLVRSGELGKLYSIESNRLNLGLFQRDTNVVWDLAPHDISILLSLLDERPTHVSVVGSKTVIHPKQPQGQESLAHIMLYYASGFIAHIHVSWISPIKVRQITIVGSTGMALYDQLASAPVVRFDQGIFPSEDEGESGPLFTYKAGPAVPVPIATGSEDLSAMLSDFSHAIVTGEEPVSGASLGLDVVRILNACERSLQKGGAKVAISYQPSHRLSLALMNRYIRFRHHY